MIVEKPGNEIPDHVISNLENHGDQPLPPEEENLSPGMEIVVPEPHSHRTLEPRWNTLMWLLKEENPRATVIPAVGNFLKTRRLVYPAQLDGIETSVLLDTGANTSFVSDRFVEQSGFSKTENSEPFPLALFVGEAPTWITHSVLIRDVRLGPLRTAWTFYITEGSARDVLLGMDFVVAHRDQLHLDLKEGALLVIPDTFRNPRSSRSASSVYNGRGASSCLLG